MYRYFIEMAFDGTSFFGWQIQPDTRTVQGEMEAALTVILRENIAVTGAGRTDTGVHARRYIAHFESERLFDETALAKLAHQLNSYLGSDIAIFSIYPVAPDMHARFSARRRTYKYFITKHKDPFHTLYSATVHPLPDIDRMNGACTRLITYSDFTSFARLHSDTRTNLCHIFEAEWVETSDYLLFSITADRFLRNMVRAIVGTMVALGQGKMSEEEFCAVIEARSRGEAGNSAPAQGLFLWDVTY